MLNLWTRGGISWRELIVRTGREVWQDEVFGQAARLAFYHFLALFPALVLALLIMREFGATGDQLRRTLESSLEGILPVQASSIVTKAIEQLYTQAPRASLVVVILSSLWAAGNGIWAVIVGLNQAYEVEEERPWWQVLLTTAALTLVLGIITLAALVLIFYGAGAGHADAQGRRSIVWNAIQWPILIVLLLIAFAVLYRFAPDLRDLQWQWSTPGAVVGVALWIGASLLFRQYLLHYHQYHDIYGPLASVAILLLWFYLSGAAILIGGELNSEIENAAARNGHPEARAPGEKRPGEGRARAPQRSA